MGLTLLDSSAAIAYLDSDDSLHSSAAEAIEGAVRDGDGLALSAVSWAEMLNGAYGGHHDEAHVREFMADFGVLILSVDEDVAERAAGLQHEFRRAGNTRESERKLRTPDALILATADVEPEVRQVIGGDDKWSKLRGLRAHVELIRDT